MVKWFKIMAVLAVVGVVCSLVAWRVASPRLIEYAREAIVREVGNALNEPVSLQALSLTLLPLKLHATGFAVGEQGELIRVDQLSLRILPWSSLKQLRPVGEARIAGLLVDVPRLRSETEDEQQDEKEEGGSPPFPFRIRDLRLADARVLIPAGDVPFDLSTESLVASGGLSPISRRFSLQVDGSLTVRRGGDVLELSEVHLVGAEARDGLVVQQLQLSGDDLKLSARLEGRDPPSHAVSATLNLARISMVDAALDPLSGVAEIDATLTGSIADPAVAADVRVERLSVDGRLLGNLTGRLTREGDVLRAASTRLDGLGGDVGVQAHLTLAGEQPLKFAVDWRRLDVATLAEVVGEDVPVSFVASGSVQGSATLRPLTVKANGSGQLAAGEVAPLEWSLDGHYDGGTGKATFQASQAQANALHADLSVASDESLSGDLLVELGEVASLARWTGRTRELPFSGRLRASATISGSLEAPAAEGGLDALDLVVFGEPVGAMRGDFFVDRQHARSDGLAIDFGDGEIHAAGTIGFDSSVRNDWQATVRNVSIDRLAGLARAVGGVDVPISQGRISATAKGHGPWKQVDATGSIEAQGFRLAGERFESLRIDGKAAWPGWEVEAAVLHAGDEHLDAQVRGRGLEEIVDARLDSAWWSLQHLQVGDSTEVRGDVQLSGALRGRVEALDGEVKLEARDLAWSEREIGDVVVDGRATAGKWQLETGLLDETLTLAAALDSKNGEFRVQADWQRADLSPLIGDRPAVQVSSSGRLQLTGDLGDPRALAGQAEVPVLLIRSGTLQLEAAQPIRLRLDKGRVDVESCELAGNGTRVQFDGGLTTNGALHLTGRGSGNLELLELIGEPLHSAEGSFAVEANVNREEGGEIELTGTVSLVDTAVDVGLPIGVTDTDGRFLLEGSRVRIERLEGQLGGGTFAVDGAVDLQRGPDLGWRIADVSGSFVPSLEQELSGQGTLKGSWTDLTVAGEIEILRALYDRNIEPRDFIPSFKRRFAPAEGRPSENVVRLDLRIHAPDDLHIDNNFARVEAMADLQVRGTAERPNLRGRIDVLTGEVFFRDRTFDVVTGVVDFRPQLDLVADLNITAETVVDTTETSYGVTVQISGTTDDPKVVLSADDPGLTQTDILALITFGKTVAQLQQGSGGSSMDALVGFVTGRVAKGVESEAESLLRVDRVEIEPAFSSTSGAFEPQVKISKDFGEDLTASIATTLGVDLQRAVNLEYRLTDRTSLLGTWESESEGQAGAVGGGVKFRREFRSVPGFSLLGK